MVRSKIAIEYCINEDNIFMLSLVYAGFQIDYEKTVKTSLYVGKEYNLARSEILKMPYFEYEIILEEINAIQKEQEKYSKQQEKDQSNMMKQFNPNTMMSNINRNMNMSMPKVNMPKI